jgi:hypothetical protein
MFFSGGTVSDNGSGSDGFHITSQTAYFSISGTRVGGDIRDQPGTIGSQRWGIYIDSSVTSPSFIIDGVNALGNTTGAFLDLSASTSNKFICSVIGFTRTAASLPNVLVNGGFQIWQRGTHFTFGNAVVCADYWICKRGSNVPNGSLNQQSGGPSGSQYYARLQRASGDASASTLFMMQALATETSLPFVGQPVILSFFARAGAGFSAPNLGSRIVAATGVDQGASLLPAGGWTNQQNFGQTNTLTSDWQFITQGAIIPLTLGSQPTSQLAVEFYFIPTGTATASDYVDLALISLQTGYSHRSIEIRPYWLELTAAQRRYRKSFPSATVPAQNCGTTAGAAYVRMSTGQSGTFGTQIPLLPPMRIAPTVVTYNPLASNSNWRNTANTSDRTVTVGDISDTGFRLDGAGGVAGSSNYVHWAADAELL